MFVIMKKNEITNTLHDCQQHKYGKEEKWKKEKVKMLCRENETDCCWHQVKMREKKETLGMFNPERHISYDW